MKILINASVSGMIENGLLVYSREMLKELLPRLKAQGHEATLVVPQGSRLEELDVRKLYLPSVCGTQKKWSFLSPIFRLAYNLFVLPFRARKFDCLYALTPHGAIWGKTPQILTVHDLIALQFPRQHRFQYWYMRLCLPLLLRHSRKVIAISKTTKDLLVERFAISQEKVVVVYNGCSQGFHSVDDASLHVESKYGIRDYIFACGISFPHKNIRFLIENYADLPQPLRQKHPLAVVGVNTSPYAQSLMQLAASLPCADAIKFLGMVPAEDLVAIYSAARLFVYPTLCEGFGMPPIEAARCGTPSLVSDLPVLREVLSLEDARYFDPSNPQSLRDALVRELSQPKVAPDRYLNYSWHNAAAAVQNQIESLDK